MVIACLFIAAHNMIKNLNHGTPNLPK